MKLEILSKETIAKLNEQIAHEFNAHNIYLAMASWCDANSFPGAAAFMYHSAEEEREHMMGIFKYVNENGGRAVVPALPEPKSEYANLRDLFETVYKTEADNTKAISALADYFLDKRDHGTYKLMLEYVEEQQEEMRKSERLLELIDLAGDDSRGLFLLDKAIAKMTLEQK